MDASDQRASLVNMTLQEVMRGSDDYIFVKDRDLVYRAGSDSVARLTGLSSAAALIGKTDFDIFPRDLAEKYRRDDRRVLATDKPIVGMVEELPDEDGKTRWTKTWKRPLRNEKGEVIGLFGQSRDISKEVLLEEKARSAADYVGLISELPCGVAVLHHEDGDFRLDFANDGFLEVHHHPEASVKDYIGRSLLKLAYPEDRAKLLAEFARICKAKGHTAKGDYRVTGADGQAHWVNIRLRRAYERDGIEYYYAAYSGLDSQKQTEEKLSESRNRLEESIRYTDLQFFTYYPGRRRCENQMLNQRFSALPTVWEDYPEDFLAYTKSPAEDAQAYRKMVAAIDGGAEQAECTVRFVYKDKYIWEKVQLKAVKDPAGRTLRAQGHSIDVTGRTQAAERLYKERVRLKTLEGGVFESFSFDLTKGSRPEVQTKDTRMLEAEITPELAEWAVQACPPLADLETRARDVLLRAASRIPEERDRERFLAACSGSAAREAVREGHYSAEVRYRRYIGEAVRWVMTSAEILPDPDSGDLIAFYYTKDDNREVIRELISESVIEKNYAGVSCLDLQSGLFTVFSGTDAELLGLSGQPYADVLAAAVSRFVDPRGADEYRRSLSVEAIRAALAGKRFYTVYNVRRQRAGELPGSPRRRMKNDIFYLDSHRDAIVFLLSDVTAIFEEERSARERLEAALLAANQASQAKSSFLSRMSHEIRTPLNAIIGMDVIAAQSVGDDAKTSDCIGKIGLASKYLLALINDILDMSRIESGKLALKSESFLIAELAAGVNNIIRPEARERGISYECRATGRLRQSYIGDQMKIQQVLVNVLGNAVKFTNQGKVTLEICPLDTRPGQERLRFTVRDTGCGIAEKDLSRIFDAFEQVDSSPTTVYGGTGLGLAITKNLVALMGGTIKVNSALGSGSEFVIEIPLTTDQARPGLAGPLSVKELALEVYDFAGRRILVAEDNDLNAEIAEALLTGRHFTVDRAFNGRDALDKFVQSPEGTYDIILMDVRMPVMDGLSATRAIRDSGKPDARKIPIIAMTANAFDEDVEKSRTAGMDAHLSKPIEPERMYMTLAEHLARRE